MDNLPCLQMGGRRIQFGETAGNLVYLFLPQCRTFRFNELHPAFHLRGFRAAVQ